MFEDEMQKITASDEFKAARSAHAKLTDDTRDVQPGDIFVLRQGSTPLTQPQAEDLCGRAAASGARAVIADAGFQLSLSVPVFPLCHPHRQLNLLAQAFWGRPSREMNVAAVTGTNGKTTTTYLMESVARAMGLRVGVLGTISHRYPGYEESSLNTTPGTLKLCRLMREMADAGCDLVAMEVSSHGIMQGRIDGIAFDAAVWNNLGTDHLDFHKTREAYGLAKRRLFDRYLVESAEAGKKPAAIANADDAEVMFHISAADPKRWGGRMMTYSCCGRCADVEIRNANWDDNAWAFDIAVKEGVYPTRLPLAGRYNLANAAGALSALSAMGYAMSDMAEALPNIGQIPGRMECVCRSPLVIVDFAHTPEAMENALTSARLCVPKGGRLIAVFGAGGDRDPSKRPMMGRIAQSCADFSYVTSDNPRTEAPSAIIDQIVAGMDGEYAVEQDRRKAIETALSAAAKNDLVMIIGKGHENYQILGTEKCHFDDREVVRNFYGLQPLPDMTAAGGSAHILINGD